MIKNKTPKKTQKSGLDRRPRLAAFLSYWIFIISGAVLACIIIIPLFLTQCKPSTPNDGDNNPPPASLVEKGAEIKEGDDFSKYLVPLDDPTELTTTVYLHNDTTIQVSNRLIDLKKFSEDHDNQTLFTIEGTISFGFLVDLDMNCHINGINANVIINTPAPENSDWVTAGIVVGRNLPNDDPDSYTNWDYSSHLQIDKNVNFFVNGANNSTFGILQFQLAPQAKIDVGAAFTIVSDNNRDDLETNQGTFGWWCNYLQGSVSWTGQLTVINYYVGSDTSHAIGLYINQGAENCTLVTSGLFLIQSSNAEAMGIYFANNEGEDIFISGTFTIGGKWTIISNKTAYGCSFMTIVGEPDQPADTQINIIGDFNIQSKIGSVIAINFSDDIIFTNVTITGTFNIAAENDAYGVWFSYTCTCESLNFNTTGYFNIKSVGGKAAGIQFKCSLLQDDTVSICGVFNIVSLTAGQTKGSYAFTFTNFVPKHLTANPLVAIHALERACAWAFKGDYPIQDWYENNPEFDIGGVYTISSDQYNYFASWDSSNDVNGGIKGTMNFHPTVSIFGKSWDNPVCYSMTEAPFSTNLTFNGIYSIYTEQGPAQFLSLRQSFTADNVININGKFLLNGATTRSITISDYSVSHPITLNLHGDFYANKPDGGNISNSIFDATNTSYNWNGQNVPPPFTSNESQPDDALVCQTISNAPIAETDPEFNILVAKECSTDAKQVFNRAYMDALDNYANSPDCLPVAKPWLLSIVSQISQNYL